jgi:hypothetical protein
MNTRKMMTAALSALVLFSVAGSAFADNRFGPRNMGYHPNTNNGRYSRDVDTQKERIRQGIRSGNINRSEAERLNIGMDKVRDYERKAWADGRISQKERWELQRLNTNLNQAIAESRSRR